MPYEVNDLLSTLFTNPTGQAPFTFTIAGQRDQGLPSLYNNDWHDFEPRVGIAWDPFQNGKTSIRAGYGIFHDRLFGQLLGLTRGNPPFQQIFFEPFFAAGVLVPVSALGPPPSLTATPIVPDFGFNASGMLQGGILPFIIDPPLRMPYSQGWNFGVQRELPGSLLLEVNYVGSRGTRLLRVVDGNPPQPALVSQLIADGVPPQLLQFDALYLGAEEGILPFDAVNNNAFLHAELFNNTASSVYHALQANITKRMSNGLAVQAAYTWSHAIDNSSDPLTPATGNQGFPRDSLNLTVERGNSDFDVRQRLTINYSWDLPFGRGHGSPASRLSLAGFPMTSSPRPTRRIPANHSARTSIRWAFLPVSNPLTQTGPNLGMSSALFFPDATFGRGGDLGRNHFRGPGINNWDTVLQKTVSLTERVNLQFRAETYNLFNRVQFGQPGNLTSDPGTFGQSTSEVRRADDTSGARQIQFGMKLQF